MKEKYKKRKERENNNPLGKSTMMGYFVKGIYSWKQELVRGVENLVGMAL